MDNQQGTITVTDFEIGWLSGIVDGEGTVAFSVFRRTGGDVNAVRVKPQIIITNTDKDLMEAVVSIFHRSGVGAHFLTREQHGRSLIKKIEYRPLHVVTIMGFKRVRKALDLISPHLISKKVKANLVLKYIKQRQGKMSERWPGRGAPSQDVEDLRLIQQIMSYSRATNVKGPKSRHFQWIEGLLNEHEQRAVTG